MSNRHKTLCFQVQLVHNTESSLETYALSPPTQDVENRLAGHTSRGHGVQVAGAKHVGCGHATTTRLSRVGVVSLNIILRVHE